MLELLQSTYLLIPIPLVMVMVLAWRAGFFYGYMWGFTIMSLLLPVLGNTALFGQETKLAIFQLGCRIVLDWRYFLLIEHFHWAKSRTYTYSAPSKLKWPMSLLLTIIVPVLTTAAAMFVPALREDMRLISLLYASLFVFALTFMRTSLLPGWLSHCSPAIKAWLARLTDFVIAYYALSAIGDLLQVARIPFGVVLVIVGNILAYGGYLLLAYLKAPDQVK